MAKSSSTSELPAGWLIAGDHPKHYRAFRDQTAARKGCPDPQGPVCLTNKIDSPEGFGTWMKMIDCLDYLDQRVRMKAWIKTEALQFSAMPWVRVDGHGRGKVLSFDNFCERKIEGDADWTLYESVVYVPRESSQLAYGVMLNGAGKVWMEEITFERAADDEPTTDCACLDEIERKQGKNGASKNKAKSRSDKTETAKQKCDQPIKHWYMTGSSPEDYVASLDKSTKHSGTQSALLTNKVDEPSDFGTLAQSCSPDTYIGKRVRMSVWLKSKDIKSWAAPWFRIDGQGSEMLGFDNCCERPLVDTTDWTEYQCVLDVPAGTTNLAYGVLLSGPGKVWIDDLSFSIVDASVATTDCRCMRGSYKPRNLSFED